MLIEVLGGGCAKCRQLEDNAKKAVAETGLEAEVVHVSDISRIVEYGVAITPALVVDGEVKCSGRIAEVEEIKNWLKRV